MNKKFIGSSIALVIGVLAIGGGVSQSGVNLIMAGIFMILGALAYKSAKKRKLGITQPSTFKFICELVAIAVIAILVLFTNSEMLVNDPFSNIVIPAWAIIAYIIVISKNISKLPTVNDQKI